MQRATVSALRQAARQATPKAARAYSLLTAARALPKAPSVRRLSARLAPLGSLETDRSARCAQATRGVKTLDFAGTKETVYERSGASRVNRSPLPTPAIFWPPSRRALEAWCPRGRASDGAHQASQLGGQGRC